MSGEALLPTSLEYGNRWALDPLGSRVDVRVLGTICRDGAWYVQTCPADQAGRRDPDTELHTLDSFTERAVLLERACEACAGTGWYQGVSKAMEHTIYPRRAHACERCSNTGSLRPDGLR